MASSIAVDLADRGSQCCRSWMDSPWVQSLRATGRKMPVLILSALGDVDDRITGCVPAATTTSPSPITCRSCLARIDALARRGRFGQYGKRIPS